MTGHHEIKVEGGDPDHMEVAALTAALFALAGRRHLLHTRRAAPHHRPSWPRTRPGPSHPAHSWQVRTHRLFD